jgi:hypothetical protein
MGRTTKTIQIEVSYNDTQEDGSIEEYVEHLLRIGKFHILDSTRQHYGDPSVGEPSLVEND